MVILWVFMYSHSGITEKTFVLSPTERRVFDLVLEHWPISSLEVASHFSEACQSREEKKRLSSKYCYYLRKLVDKRLVLAKRAGNSFIVWPLVVEKYRTIHHILSE